MKKNIITLCFLLFCFSLLAQNKSLVNQLSTKEKKEGWSLLFDGKTLNGWHLYNEGNKKSAWVVVNNELKCDPTITNVERGDLVSDKEFENYELKFEWKISLAGNSGVFFNVLEREDIPKAWASGPEYQLLEKSHHDFETSPLKRAGALYNFIAPPKDATKPFGQWNQSIIKQKNGKVQFYLNEVLTAEQNLASPEWKEMVAKSGFKSFPEFGKYTKGRISLQDWSAGISFRNIKIKEN